MKRFIVALCFGLFSALALSAERQQGALEFTLWGFAHHTESAPAGQTFEEWNPGIGVRYYLAPYRHWELFLQADYIARNSTGGQLAQAGIGAQYPLHHTERFDVLVGAVGGIVSYENTWSRERALVPGAYPFIALRYQAITIDIGYIPKISAGTIGTHPAAVISLHVAY